MSAWQTIIYEKHGSVAHLILNRPASLNAYNVQMRDDFSEALTATALDDEVKALIISGRGRAFCAGADLSEFGTAPSLVAARQVRWERDVWGQLNSLPIPVVASVHGYCIGSGVEIMLLTDIRIAAQDTAFAMPELQLGMIPAAGGSQTLPRSCGDSRALDLLLTGRRFGALEALEIGLITRIVPPEELHGATWALATALAQGPSPTLSCAKEAIRKGLDMGLRDGLQLEERLARATLGPSSGRDVW